LLTLYEEYRLFDSFVLQYFLQKKSASRLSFFLPFSLSLLILNYLLVMLLSVNSSAIRISILLLVLLRQSLGDALARPVQSRVKVGVV